MEFCPTCGMLLQFELNGYGHSTARFCCPICPYVSPMQPMVKIKKKQRLIKKDIEPIFSADDMKNAPSTDAPCPRCGHGKAAFQQHQLRSADEPMSTFYWCLNDKCRNQWRED